MSAAWEILTFDENSFLVRHPRFRGTYPTRTEAHRHIQQTYALRPNLRLGDVWNTLDGPLLVVVEGSGHPMRRARSADSIIPLPRE